MEGRKLWMRTSLMRTLGRAALPAGATVRIQALLQEIPKATMCLVAKKQNLTIQSLMVMMMNQLRMEKLERFMKRLRGVLRTSSRDSTKESAQVSLYLGNRLEVLMGMPTAVHMRTGTLVRAKRITKMMK